MGRKGGALCQWNKSLLCSYQSKKAQFFDFFEIDHRQTGKGYVL